MERIIRKISVGQNFPDGLHYQVGSEMTFREKENGKDVRKKKIVGDILEVHIDGEMYYEVYLISVHSDINNVIHKDKLPWKLFPARICVCEYKIDFE